MPIYNLTGQRIVFNFDALYNACSYKDSRPSTRCNPWRVCIALETDGLAR